MSRRTKSILAVSAALLLLAAAVGGTALAQGTTPWSGRGMMGQAGQGMMNIQNMSSMMGQSWQQGNPGQAPGNAPGGMMRGMMGDWASQAVTGTLPFDRQAMHNSMMGQGGQGMMGAGGMMGPGMMQGQMQGMMQGNAAGMQAMMAGADHAAGCPMAGGQTGSANAQPVTAEAAKTAIASYLKGLNNDDLVLGDFMEFSANFYAEIKEKSTGNGAFELLIDRYTGLVHPEPGPNMMWNTKYGHMSRGQGQQPAASALSIEQAAQAAQKYLDANVTGAKVESDGSKFYGYYTFDYTKDGKVAGMLSVNGTTGQAWLHTWHGEFIAE